MSTKKAKGSSAQHKSQPGKRLGLKFWGGEKIKKGQIIVRQRGTKVKAGSGVGVGRDHTLFALIDGTVIFKKRQDRQVICVNA